MIAQTPLDPAALNPSHPYVVAFYAIYVLVAIGLTVFLARTLYRNGGVFLADVFTDSEGLAEAVNRLLVVGFYMLNLGYALLILRTVEIASAGQLAQTLTNRLGLLLVSLGIIHFVNLAVFWKMKHRAEPRELPPPIPPQALADQHDPHRPAPRPVPSERDVIGRRPAQ